MSRRSRTLSVSEAEFQALVQEALDSVPEPYAEHLANVAVVVEEEPSQEVLDELELEGEDDLLGLYQGVSIDKESFFQAGGQLPAHISIYRGPILRLSGWTTTRCRIEPQAADRRRGCSL
jgi:predicted Zn-dependent protease with MMP-like domain